MKRNADHSERLRALTELDSTLLVEAAAGTGKTALIAGRLTMLLASGCAPASIAAITFTEAAASELSARVQKYVTTLLANEIPVPLRAALPQGLSASQRAALSSAQARLEELTTSTIHGFCQTLILSYSVEADIDPGAQMMDATHADTAFDMVFDQWLRERLGADATQTGPIGVLSKRDPQHVVGIIRNLARFRLRHRVAQPMKADLDGRPDIDLFEAVQAFKHWKSGAPVERTTDLLLIELEKLAAFYHGTFHPALDFESLWKLAHPLRLTCMRASSSDLKRPALRSVWKDVAGDDGERFADEALAHFTAVDMCYRTLMGKVATALVASLSAEIDEVLSRYADFKRGAALLDFDDLLYRARQLVGSHEHVRLALGQRYARILVDEFQDTDPVQAEILFRIASSDRPAAWELSRLRDGALFMVGDPKQAIYRFRGADIEIYERARNAIRQRWPQNVVHITNSFRSDPAILAHVNQCFEQRLSAPGQPGYVSLTSARESIQRPLPCVAQKAITLPPNPKANDIRDAEALVVAETCARLIGNMEITTDDGVTRKLLASDIALLAPTGTELWRYEQALAEHDIPYESQAGKNLFDRQEVQDLVSLARAIADPFDSLAFGALMRGPLVGLTEEELLDICAQLPKTADHPEALPRFNVWTDPTHVDHRVAKEALQILQALRRGGRSKTPMLLLSEAIERLHVRPIVLAREGSQSGRAFANIDAFLELARGYDVRGLKQFVRDIANAWAQREPHSEGRVDTSGDALEIVTMHSSKGLEWPVVIVINTVTQLRPREKFVYRSADNTIHWVLDDVVPPDLLTALAHEEENAARERERLFYVAYTRARDLLVLPRFPNTGAKTWSATVPDPYECLVELDVANFEPQPRARQRAFQNEQTAEVFLQERRVLEESLRTVHWIHPSTDDGDRVPVSDLLVTEPEEGLEVMVDVGAGHVRGLVLHKLMEEVFTGESSEEAHALTTRAAELLSQLVSPTTPRNSIPRAEELSATILRTLALPDIARLRYGLVPEVGVWATLMDPAECSIAGRADALFIENDHPSLVIDWKSDINPSDSDIAAHAAQLRTYMRAVRVSRGALVYFSTGRVHWLQAEAA